MNTATPREQIAELLSEVGAPDTFAAKQTAPTDDLHIEVKGIGQLRLPVSRGQAQSLCRIARPARYGQGEKTLLDPEVRDTWKVPKSRVKIDKRRWNRTLLPALEALRADLGLPDGSRLRAELHAMLVYSPGQFFERHQDSEKADEMIGTLVVMLPASFKGGALVVEHNGERVTCRGSKKFLSFVAFYADCQHEVRPVKDGYRVVLTYNLMLDGDAVADAASTTETAPATVEILARHLREHFETPLPSRVQWKKDAPLRHPPTRLVYLLDHQYTERGLAWHRLKGNDAGRAAVLRAAAERCDCELVLGLTEIHETWSCMEPGWDEPRFGRHRHWDRDEDEEWYEDDDSPVDDPEAYELVDLVDSGITLSHWVGPADQKAVPIATWVDPEEACASTRTSELEAHSSEYTGYMGNYGNTMDRWYRRAAIVLWPRERAFAVRAEASPALAMTALKRHIKAGGINEAREMAASLLPFWKSAAPGVKQRDFFENALRVADGLDAAVLATSLLQPFRVEALTPGRAAAWVALVGRYGEGWERSLLSEWSSSDTGWGQRDSRDPLRWLSTLPRLCEALRAADDTVGRLSARLLLQDRWNWCRAQIEEAHLLRSPSRRDSAMAALPRPILGILEGAAVVEAEDLAGEAVTFLCADENAPLLPYLVQMLRAAAGKKAPKARAAPGLVAIQEHCVRRLSQRLELPARDGDDWAIALPDGCRCELCATLRAFLGDPDGERLEWPIAKKKRMHVHRRLDAHELPVRHKTRRVGRPYTLELRKTKAVFEREAEARLAWQSDLEWLTGPAGTPGSRRSGARRPR